MMFALDADGPIPAISAMDLLRPANCVGFLFMNSTASLEEKK